MIEKIRLKKENYHAYFIKNKQIVQLYKKAYFRIYNIYVFFNYI